jgi:hypothetical protein
MPLQPTGGSFAPPLTDELLAKYSSMIDGLAAQSPIRDAMAKLLACCKQWWGLPESTGKGEPHPSGRGSIVDLDEAIKKTLWEAIPWKEELQMYGLLFERIDAVKEKPLRDAAHHLLWHGFELEMDREPITMDKL